MTDSPESPWREVLPLVVETAAKSAEASTAAATAIASFENRIASLESSVNTCGDKLAALVALEDERKKRETERSAWARSILTPQFLVYLITLLLALAGFRVTMVPDIAPIIEQEAAP
jgi:type II secretory pathway component PulF